MHTVEQLSDLAHQSAALGARGVTGETALMVFDHAGRVCLCNSAAATLFQSTPEALTGRTATEFCIPLAATLAAPESRPITFTAKCPDQSERLLQATLYPFQHGDASSRIVVLRDLKADWERDEHARKLAVAVEQTADAVLISDHLGTIEFVNAAFTRATGYKASEAVGKTPALLKSGKHDQLFYRRLWATLRSGQAFYGVFINRHKNGDLVYEEKTITPLRDETGAITHFVSTAKDVTEREQSEERLRYLTNHDPLTGLPNRTLLLDRLQQLLWHSERQQQKVALAYIGLDQLKRVNDTLGHVAGDTLLQLFAMRLNNTLHDSETIARIGSDEFAIIFATDMAGDSLATRLGRLLKSFIPPLVIGGQTHYLTASIGVALAPDHTQHEALLLQYAGAAMCHAQQDGRNRYVLYEPRMSQQLSAETHLTNALRAAATTGQFDIHYQPQTHLAKDEIIGLEALLRWPGNADFQDDAAKIVAKLEDIGEMDNVGEWLLHRACQQVSALIVARAIPSCRLTINLSAAQLRNPALLDTVKHALQRSTFDPSRLEFDIKESTLLISNAHVLNTLKELKSLGVRIAVDDFGTSFSSLPSLRRFAPSAIKIDRSFISELPENADANAVVTAILSLARALGIETIAKGVESAAQLAWLKQAGCDAAFGRLLSSPMPFDALQSLSLRAGTVEGSKH